METHLGPWKCPDANCTFNESGFPAEKERDRHVMDKHGETPLLFKCEFSPCSYESKQKSNLQEHMKKAHGWKNDVPIVEQLSEYAYGNQDNYLQELQEESNANQPSSGDAGASLLANHDPSDNENPVVDAKSAKDFDVSESSHLKQDASSTMLEPPHIVTRSIKKEILELEAERRLLEERGLLKVELEFDKQLLDEESVRPARENSPKRKAVGQPLPWL